KARECFEKCLKPGMIGLYPQAREKFNNIRLYLDKALKGVKALKNLDSYSFGDSLEEKRYRKWALDNKLFLNPMNDAYLNSISARDVLSLPNISVSMKEKMPWRHGLFDQLKQEYVSARYLYYESIHPEKVHFSDKDVRLINSMDYPSYGLSTEKLKSSFRMLF